MRAVEFNPNVKQLLEQEEQQLRAVIFIGSLKPNKKESSTYTLALDVEEQLLANGVDDVRIVYLHEFQLDPGITRKVGNPEDRGPRLYSLIEEADIVILGTPIWWGVPSSLIQRVIERMDEFDEYYLKGDVNHLYGKVFGMIITGTEDGVQACAARLAGWATHLGFTTPPEALAYWLRKEPYKKGTKDETANHYTNTMARNLAEWAKVLKKQKLTSKSKPTTWK